MLRNQGSARLVAGSSHIVTLQSLRAANKVVQAQKRAKRRVGEGLAGLQVQRDTDSVLDVE
jgi:hypothetical protein